MMRPLAVLLLLAPAACAPIVTHGPRVEPGLHFTGTLGVARNACDTACSLDILPQIGMGARYGRAADDGRPGYSVAGTLALGLVSSELDAYVQAPTSPSWAAGGGLLLSPAHVMPYLQAGRVEEDGSGLYTTQGFAVLASRERVFDIDEDLEVAPRYWAPTLAYRAAYRGGAIHVYLSGAVGWMDVRAVEGQSRREPVRLLMAGLSFEQRIRGTLLPILPPLRSP
ncbi:MAG TPA: hypothetical protein VFR37_07155 [Longimicrobium sp.]|nr:hypothetical protein [Longimicrobium sp.]